MHRLIVLLGFMACDAGKPAPAPTTPPPPPVSAIVSADGHQYAIVRVTEVRPEPCQYDRAGNWTFSVEGSALQLFGDRHIGLRGDASLPDRIASNPSGYYVAEIALGEVSEPVTCNGIERFDGTVLAVAPARDLADARAQLAAPHPALASTVAPLPEAAILANPIVSANGSHYAIVKLQGTIPETCTDMGGTNWIFSVEGMPADYKLHGGGHGIYGEGSTLPSMLNAAEDEPFSRYYVAEVTLATHGKVTSRFLCSGRQEVTTEGTVLAVAPARDLAEARAKLASVTSEGLRGAVRIDQLGK